MWLKRIAILLFMALPIEFGISGKSAVGQAIPDATPSATPVATPTAAPSLPSGRELLRRMKAATDRFGTHREEDQLVTFYPNGSRSMVNAISEVSIRRNRSRTVETFHPSHPDGWGSAYTVESVLVGSRDATRGLRAAWDCTDLKKTLPGTGFGVSEPQVATTHFNGRIRTLEATTVGTLPVWHVREMSHQAFHGEGVLTISTTIDYFIAQKNFTLRLRGLSLSLHNPDGITKITDTTRYSD